MDLIQELVKRKAAGLGPMATSYNQPADVREIEEEPDDLRTCFQVDKERIVLSRAFRRLKHKTQMFWAAKSDRFRTRLTHTLEVCQNSYTISAILALNTDLAEAIALGHDLGHSPFGHAGERAIDEYCQQYLNRRFHHNVQSAKTVREKGETIIRPVGLRGTVSERQIKGLNLCCQVIDGIEKHEAFWSDSPSTLEGQVVRWADVISYVNHDYEDLREAHIVTGDLRTELQQIGNTHLERVHNMISDVVRNSLNKDKVSPSVELLETFQEIRDIMKAGVYDSQDWRKREEGAKHCLYWLLNHWRSEPDNVIEGSLPKEIFDRIQESGKRDDVILDFVVGMTDTFALEKYNEIFMPEVRNYYW